MTKLLPRPRKHRRPQALSAPSPPTNTTTGPAHGPSTSSREKGWSFTRWPRPGRKATSPVPLAGRRGATRSGRQPGTDKRSGWDAAAGVGGAPGKDARAAGPLDFPAWRAQFDMGGGGTAWGLTAPGLSPEASAPHFFFRKLLINAATIRSPVGLRCMPSDS